jgi:thymidine phosphorylase
MNQPIGREVGNANEIAESLDLLAGNGPADAAELTYALGVEMLLLAGVTDDATAALALLESAVSSGRAMEKFGEVISAQGGDPRVIEDRSLLDRAPGRHEVTAPRDGFVTRCDALDVGVASVRLGGGRARKEDLVDHGVGITIHRKQGDAVETGESLAVVTYRDEVRLAAALPLLESAWEIADQAAAEAPLILGEVR